MAKKIEMEVFKTGSQTDSAGNTRVWTETDLDKIVKKFEEMAEDVPATIGHPESDTAPAYGWFKRVYRKGGTLMAELSDVVDEFGEMLKNKMYKKRSIALRPDFSLRHIAFLGGAAPAVKGLADFKFSANDTWSFFEDENTEFSEIGRFHYRVQNAFRALGEMFQGMRDQKIEKDGLEKANAVFPMYGIDNLKNFEIPQEEAPVLSPAFAEHQPENQPEGAMTPEQMTAKITELETANAGLVKDLAAKEAKFSEDLTAEKARADAAEAKLAGAAVAAKEKEFAEFIESQVQAGRVLPANRELFLKTMKALDGQEAMDFSENGNTAKITPLDVFKRQIAAGAQEITFGEQFANGQAPKNAGDQLQAEADKIANENKGMSFSEAFKKACADHPELAKQYGK